VSAENLSEQEAFERFEGRLRDWLRDSGGQGVGKVDGRLSDL